MAPPSKKPVENLDFDKIRQIASERGGSIIELEHHVLAHIPGKDRLVVTFDNLRSMSVEGPRMPWGYDLLAKQGWGVLGVMVKRKDWFRAPDLYAQMERLRDQGLFASYPTVSFYGSSMGGYGACNFARLAPGSTVVAFAPQSSLSKEDAPFESRYRYAQNVYDWTSPQYRDAVEGIGAAGKAYLIYDPLVPEDRAHAARLDGPNAVHLSWPHLSHKVPPTMRRMGILKPFALAALTGELTREGFTQMLRVRKETTLYLVRMLEHAAEAGHAQLVLSALASVPDDKRNWKLNKLARDTRAKLAGAPRG